MNTAWQDIRYSLRKLAKNPGFTVVAIVTLALGVGANSAIFSVVHNVIMRPLQFEEPEGLVMVWEHNIPRNQERNVVASVNFHAWRAQNQSFEEMAAWFTTGVTMTGLGEAERVQAAVVSPTFFRILRVEAAHGRTFFPEEGEVESSEVVILSHGFWLRRFGGQPDVLGSTINLGGTPYTVVGIMPPDFKGVLFGSLTERDMWMPLPWSWGTEYGGRGWMVIARLKDGVDLQGGQAEMSTITARLEREHDYNEGWTANVVSLHEQTVGEVRPALLVLLSAVGLILLIACANVANLLLARASGREREMAIRTAIGASRGRVIRQLMTESGLLAILGGVSGLLLAVWGIDVLIKFSPGDIPRTEDIGLNYAVLLFTLAASLLAGFLFGFTPAMQASKPDLHSSLREASGGSGVAAGRRLRGAFVVSEVALAVLLLIGAGLVIRSFSELTAVDPGFDAENVLGFRVSLPGAAYPDQAQQTAFFQELIRRVESLPGVTSAGATIARPLGRAMGPGTSFILEDRPEPPRADRPVADIRAVTPGYFRTLGVPLISGRSFTERDRAESPLAVVINQTMARTFWPDENAVGHRVSVSWDEMISAEIVGVVGDVRHGGLDAVPRAKIYFAHAQFQWSVLDLVVRAGADPAALVAAIRGEVAELDPNLPVYSVSTMRELVTGSVAEERFNMLLLSLFAAVALLLASVGIYGVLSYSVTQRTHEIGVRVALGAEGRSVLRLVVGQGMALAGAGVLVGVLAAFGLTRLMTSLLYEVSATDPLTYAAVVVILLLVALAACYVPAWRATRVDPVVALKYE